MDESAPTLLQTLEREFCPPLDSALFAAIVSDYNLDGDDSVQILRDTLEALRISAEAEDNLSFDPSGTSGRDSAEDAQSEPAVSRKTPGSLTTDLTGVASSISSMCLDQDGESGRESSYSSQGTRSASGPSYSFQSGAVSTLDFDGKVSYLAEMFPAIERFTISHTLRKCSDDVDRSMDELLNLTFFDEEDPADPSDKVSVPKGIDGFAHGPRSRKGRNKKGKGRENRGHMVGVSEPSSPLAACNTANKENKWDNGKNDVEFICARIYLPYQSVASAYHLNGASLATTIHFLSAQEADKHSKEMMDDPVTISQIAGLQEEFSSIPHEKLAGLLRLVRRSSSAASELAAVMVATPVASFPIDLRLQPSNDPLPSEWKDGPTKRRERTARTNWSGVDHAASRAYADRHFLAGQNAFAKANSAYRRGKSDRLMGAAAGYYSSVGREHFEKSKKESMAGADALAYSQSTATTLDLHGISVQDAVRIASSQVLSWWDSLGDSKYVSGGRNPAKDGYRIVTGKGTHSSNGTSRIGPAVAKMLVREGWNVEIGQGELLVTGLVKHR